MSRDVTNNAIAITANAASRSDHRARLKKTHHTKIASKHTSMPINPMIVASGLMAGTTYLKSNRSTAATTPGHRRSGFLGMGSSKCLSVGSVAWVMSM